MKRMSILVLVMAVLFGGCARPQARITETWDLLVSERARISRVAESGESEQFVSAPGLVRVLGGEVFVLRGRDVFVYDTTGKEHRRISVPTEVRYFINFVVLTGKRVAYLDNRNDVIYFVDANGKHLKTVSFAEKANGHLQNMDGVVVGNRLVVSENGDNELISVDLSTYQVSIFRDLKQLRGWLGAIAWADGRYYICQSERIYTFSEDLPEVKEVATTPEGNITGIACAQGRLFAVVNGMSRINERSLSAKYRTTQGILYEVNPETGEVKQLKDGLNYPDGVAVVSSPEERS